MGLKDLYTSSSVYESTPSDTTVKPTTTSKKSGLSALLENATTEEAPQKAQNQPTAVVPPNRVEVTPETPFVAPKQSSIFSRLADAFSKGVENITGRPDYTTKPASPSLFKNTLRELPSAITETILPAVGALRDNPELVSEQNVGVKDIVKEIPKQVVETGKQFIKSPISGALNITGVPTKIKISGLGEVTNSQYEASRRIADGEDPTIVALSEGGNAILNSLFFLGLTSKVFQPRPSAITPKLEPKVNETSGIPVDKGAKSFRLYEQPTITRPIDPVTLKKIIVDNNIPLKTDYNPNYPTYFKTSGGVKDGRVTGKFYQLKPSLFDTFVSKFKGDINNVPENQLVPVATISRNVSEIKNIPLPKTPESAPVVKSPLDIAPVSPETPAVPVENKPTNLIKLAQEDGISVPEIAPSDELTPVATENQPQTISNDVSPDVQTMIEQGMPRDVATKAETDWQDNFAEKVAEIESKISDLQTQLKTTPAKQQAPIKSEINKLLNQSIEIENKFVEKWKTGIPEAPKEKALFTPRKQAIDEVKKVKRDIAPEKKYYIQTYADNKGSKTNFAEVQGKPIEIAPNLDTFIYKEPSGVYIVTEGRSGMKLANGSKVRKTAIDEAIAQVEKYTKSGGNIEELIKSQIEKRGLSPRYAEPKKLFRQKTKVAESKIKPRVKSAVTDREQMILKRNGLTENSTKKQFNEAISREQDRLTQKYGTVMPEQSNVTLAKDYNDLPDLEAIRNKVAKNQQKIDKNVEASLADDFKEGKIAPATSPEELTRRIEQLNKFGQSRAILRRTGGLSKNTAGIFRSQKGNPLDRGTVHLQDNVVKNLDQYMSVLGHELGHALEKAVTGETNVDTYKVFGRNLSPDIKNKIKAELKVVTNEMVGEAKAKDGAGYYYKDTELLARFLQKMFESSGNLSELAPTALEYFEKSSIENPIVGEYLDAVRGTIDKGQREKIFLRDMKQTYQKVLGARVGEMAWNDEVRYRAMKQRAIVEVEKLIKNKFKNVKDDPALLFQSAEAIKITEGGVPEFGTRDFQYAKNDDDVARLMGAGYEPITQDGKPVTEIIDGEEYARFAKTRYTPEQGKAIFDQLSSEGKQLIKDFTSSKAEAKDYFNREMIKDVNKINSNIEGWVHHFWEDTTGIFGKNRLKTKTASAKKQRAGAEGYVQDLQKAMKKALTEIETTKAYNAFINEYFARVTEPIAKGEKPKQGYIEVVGDIRKGGVGTSFENRTTVIQNGKAIPVQKPRYQMPAVIYERYKMISDIAKEASTATEIMNSINRYWRVNILFHPGSAMTNFISGGIQYGTKVLTDFYTEILTGNLSMDKTRANIGAMLRVLTPKGWDDAPDWVYGGDLSNYYGEFMTGKSPGVDVVNKSVDLYADKALSFYGKVERYWKKVISTAEGVHDLKNLSTMTKEGLRLPTELEKQLLDEINSEVDLFAYDYDNVPVWLQNYNQGFFGQAVKPFTKYPYKYAKHITEMATAIFDETQPKQERIAKLLSLVTIMALYAYVREKRKKKQKTPEVPETAPTSVSTRGRLFIGTDKDGKEMFTRTAKYPFINLTETGANFIEGNSSTGFDSLTDMIGSVAPTGQILASLFGYKNKYQMYTPPPVIISQNIASFVPGTRILQDIARFFDPYQRKPETFTQGLTSLIPLPSASEDLRAKLRGDIKTIRVPIEGEVKGEPGTRRTTIDQAVLNYKNDILMGLLGGIYVNRIDPEQAKAFIIRKEKNTEKAEKKSDKENKPLSMIKKGVSALFGTKSAYADTIENAKAEEIGLISVPEKWNSAIGDTYTRYPDVPKGFVETVLFMESSMGKNASLKKKDFGEYGYLGGHTHTGTFKHLLDSAQKDPKLEAKIRLFDKKDGKYVITNIKNLGDEYSAIQATGSVIANLGRNNPKLDPVELYFKKYVTAKSSDTKARRELFQKAFNFYSQKSLQ